jgi:hypothetical protein
LEVVKPYLASNPHWDRKEHPKLSPTLVEGFPNPTK